MHTSPPGGAGPEWREREKLHFMAADCDMALRFSCHQLSAKMSRKLKDSFFLSFFLFFFF
jgi:hypothetical protein